MQFWAPQYKKDIDVPEQVQHRTPRVVQGLQHLAYGDKMRDLGFLSLERRRVEGYTVVYNYLMTGCREDRLFSKMHSGKMRGTRDKLEHRK